MSKNHPFKHIAQFTKAAGDTYLATADIERARQFLGAILGYTSAELTSKPLKDLETEFDELKEQEFKEG